MKPETPQPVLKPFPKIKSTILGLQPADKLPWQRRESEPQLEPEYSEAFQQWQQDPSPASRGRLLTQLAPVMDTAVRAYGGSPTLRSKAKLLTLTALQAYDPAKGSLRQHVLSRLRGLQRLSAREQQSISIPEQVILDRQHLRAAEAELEDRLGRPGSDTELADHTGLSRKRLGYIRQARPTINTGRLTNPQTGEAADVAAKMQYHNPTEEAWESLVYEDLGPVDQLVLDYTLGRQGRPKLSGKAIAAKLGISPSAVSQRAAKIQGLLDERLASNVFGE